MTYTVCTIIKKTIPNKQFAKLTFASSKIRVFDFLHGSSNRQIELKKMKKKKKKRTKKRKTQFSVPFIQSNFLSTI